MKCFLLYQKREAQNLCACWRAGRMEKWEKNHLFLRFVGASLRCTPRKGRAACMDFSRRRPGTSAEQSKRPCKSPRVFVDTKTEETLGRAQQSARPGQVGSFWRRGAAAPPLSACGRPASGCCCLLSIPPWFCCLDKWKMSTSRCVWISRSLRFVPLTG